MKVTELEPYRRVATTRFGEVSYLDVGEGPVALFVHGVFVNAHLWRNVIAPAREVRRCIAVDLPAHGRTMSSPTWDYSLPALATMLAELCDHLGVDQVDLVGNDTGGAVCQVFATSYPQRLRTLTLTDCDTQGNYPPAAFESTVDLARTGGLVPIITRLASDLDLGRSKIGLGSGYERPDDLTDEVLISYLGPFGESDARASELERFVAGLDDTELSAVHGQLRRLEVPTLLVWGTDDVFFDLSWARWLADTIPGVTELVEVEGARLFFPDERPDELLAPMLRHWQVHQDFELGREESNP